MTFIRKMDVVFRFGLMVQDMTASGEMAWPMAMADLFTQKVTYMRENGPRTKLTDSVFIPISMEVDTRANGTRISNMVMVLSSGQMVPSTMVNTSKV